MKELIKKWKNFKDLDLALKEELESLNDEELYDSFYTDLTFGTGGMRGILGPGTNRMNIYTIRRANYGYGKYILMDTTKEHSVVIAYDCRKNSLLFAKESARVLATLGIKVYLFDKITPTPELSFAVRYLNACGGINITASHNPKQYNGYITGSKYDKNWVRHAGKKKYYYTNPIRQNYGHCKSLAELLNIDKSNIPQNHELCQKKEVILQFPPYINMKTYFWRWLH